MKLATKYHGTREYNKEDIIIFKKGLPGFENLKEFILFPVEDNELFSILHSIQNQEIGIVVISPFQFFQNYEFRLSDEKLKELNLSSPEDVLVLNTVTLNSSVEKITTNLKAPIIININNKLGEQIILDDDKYAIKQPLFEVKALNGL